MPFKKGHKFGKGRPKGTVVEKYSREAREWAIKRGWGKLIQWAEGAPIRDLIETVDGKKVIRYHTPADALQVEATKILMAYGIGKPRERVEVEDITNKKTVICIYPEGFKKKEAIEVKPIKELKEFNGRDGRND